MYRFLQGSFNAALQKWDLLLDITAPLNEAVRVVIRRVQLEMENGPHQIRFNTRSTRTDDVDSSPIILPHERLPFSLLGLIDCGRAHADGHVRLQTRPSQNLTLTALCNNTNFYAHPTLCIEGPSERQHLTLHSCKYFVFNYTMKYDMCLILK